MKVLIGKLMFASHHNLDNLVSIVDYNKLQSIDPPKLTLNLNLFDQNGIF